MRRPDPAGTLEALSRTFLDSALDCIITMDGLAGAGINPASERVFGFTRSEAVGKELAELIIPPDFGKDTTRAGSLSEKLAKAR